MLDEEDDVDENERDTSEVGKGVFVQHAEEALLLLMTQAESDLQAQGLNGDEEDVEAQVEAALASIRAREKTATQAESRVNAKQRQASELEDSEADSSDNDDDDDAQVPPLRAASHSSSSSSDDDESADGRSRTMNSSGQDGLLSSVATSVVSERQRDPGSPLPNSVHDALAVRAERQREFEELLREHSQRLERIEAVSYGDALHQKMQADAREYERQSSRRTGRGDRPANHRKVYFDDENPPPPSVTLLGGKGANDDGGEEDNAQGPLRLSTIATKPHRDDDNDERRFNEERQQRMEEDLQRYDAFGAGNLDFHAASPTGGGRPLNMTPDQWARSRGVTTQRRSPRQSPRTRAKGNNGGVSAVGNVSSSARSIQNRQAAAIASAVIQADVQRTLGMTGDLRATVVQLTQQLERMTEANKNLGERCNELEQSRNRTATEYVSRKGWCRLGSCVCRGSNMKWWVTGVYLHF